MKTDFTFDLNNVYPPMLSTNETVFVEAVKKKQKRICDPIDKRIKELEAEFHELVEQYQLLESEFEITEGFFSIIKCRNKIKRLYGRICIVRDLMETLYHKQRINTYG
jgi:hypothetical protein